MNIHLKSLLYLLLFGLLHFGYESTGLKFLKPICGTNESVFQHLKIGFFAYFFTSSIEFGIIKRRFKGNSFWCSRTLAVIFVPWIIFLIWYLVPAIWGKVTLVVELSWALIVTYISGVFAGIIEKDLEKLRFSSRSKIITFILFVISAFLFIWFTYRLPWIDLFVDPSKLG
ncbi:hypothetical protein H5T89_06825 [bacterium]|nr:hypothetical protein [bacterium]